MKPTTAQRFGSLGKSFGAPAAASAVIGAALLASDTSDTSETAWSPAAACLLPDVLPVAGTLLSYGGNRQLAAGGTVTHSGALNLGANALTVGAITASGNVVVGGGATLNWTGSTLSLASQSFNALGVNLWNGSRLGFCAGYGVSDVSIARVSSTGLAAYTTSAGTTPADWTCGAITASGAVNTGVSGITTAIGGNGFNFASAGYFVASSNGVFKFSDNTDATFNRLQLGGTTSSYPAIKRSGTTTAFRLADDSADGPISCGAITASGAIQETPTQSALNPTTTNIPSGKRMGWYNSTLSEFRDWVNIGGTLLKSAAYT